MTRDIVVEQHFAHAPETVWKVLITADLIGQWLMPNDFKAEPGHKFTFRGKPKLDWDGIVHCEVLEIEPARRLVYSWKGGVLNKDGSGSGLDTIVTWTLTPADGGTLLRMVHAGFRTPQNDLAYSMMSPGWGSIVHEGIARVLDQPSS
jgi:uncharacterized protein YndB with AHSA1/START domain